MFVFIFIFVTHSKCECIGSQVLFILHNKISCSFMYSNLEYFTGGKNCVVWYWNLRFSDCCISKYLQEHYNTVYHESSALLKKKCTRYFFQRDTSSESNYNRSCWGRPSGWNCFSVPLSFTQHVRDIKRGMHPYWVSLYIAISFHCIIAFGNNTNVTFLVKIDHDDSTASTDYTT